MTFDGKVAVVTGASRGIGAAVARQLAEQGASIGLGTNVCPGGVATDFAMDDGRGRTPDMPQLAGMMNADDVADAVLFVLSRPRNHRILEIAFRPTTEESWG